MPRPHPGGSIETTFTYACRAGDVGAGPWRAATRRIDRERERLVFALRAHVLETGLDLVLRVEPDLLDRVVAELLLRTRDFCETQTEDLPFEPVPGAAFDELAARASTAQELRLLVSSLAEAGIAFAVTLFLHPPAPVPLADVPPLIGTAFARYATRLLTLPLPLGPTPEGQFRFDVRRADLAEWLRRMEQDPDRFSRCGCGWAKHLGGELLVEPVELVARVHQDGVRDMLEKAAAGVERPSFGDGGLPAFDAVVAHAAALRDAGIDPALVYVAAYAGAHEAGLSFLALPEPLLDPLEMSRAIRAVAHVRFIDILDARAAFS